MCAQFLHSLAASIAEKKLSPVVDKAEADKIVTTLLKLRDITNAVSEVAKECGVDFALPSNAPQSLGEKFLTHPDLFATVKTTCGTILTQLLKEIQQIKEEFEPAPRSSLKRRRYQEPDSDHAFSPASNPAPHVDSKLSIHDFGYPRVGLPDEEIKTMAMHLAKCQDVLTHRRSYPVWIDSIFRPNPRNGRIHVPQTPMNTHPSCFEKVPSRIHDASVAHPLYRDPPGFAFSYNNALSYCSISWPVVISIENMHAAFVASKFFKTEKAQLYWLRVHRRHAYVIARFESKYTDKGVDEDWTTILDPDRWQRVVLTEARGHDGRRR